MKCLKESYIALFTHKRHDTTQHDTVQVQTDTIFSKLKCFERNIYSTIHPQTSTTMTTTNSKVFLYRVKGDAGITALRLKVVDNTYLKKKIKTLEEENEELKERVRELEENLEWENERVKELEYELKLAEEEDSTEVPDWVNMY